MAHLIVHCGLFQSQFRAHFKFYLTKYGRKNQNRLHSQWIRQFFIAIQLSMVLSWVTLVWIRDSLMWKYKFVLVETGMVRTVRYILLIRSIFLFVSSKLSLCGFGLDCEIGLRDQRSCFSFFFSRFCWFQTNSNRTLFKEGSSRDYTDQWKN